jgi:hypothetical protein
MISGLLTAHARLKMFIASRHILKTSWRERRVGENSGAYRCEPITYYASWDSRGSDIRPTSSVISRR